MPLTEIPKPPQFRINDVETLPELARAIEGLDRYLTGMAIVLIDEEGRYHSYQFGCEAKEMFDCATVLTEWARQMKQAED